jgi:PAS domain-containing protein
MDINLRDLETFNSTKAPVMFWDMNEVCRYGNPTFFNWFGKTPADIIGKLELKTLLGDSTYQNNQSLIKKALSGSNQSIELKLSILEAESKEVLLTFLPYTINDHVIGFFLHITDFTELRQMAKKESFEKPSDGVFLSFVENTPVPAWIVDVEGMVHYINDAFKEVKPQIKMGQSFIKSFPADIAESYQKSNREILAQRKTFIGTEKISGLLGERIFKIVKFPLLYKNKNMIGGFAIDITDQVSLFRASE